MLRILIADDHPIVRRCVRLTLEENGWEVCGEATTGREAVTMTAEQKPEVVVLDLSMPELNGLDAAREIFELRKEEARSSSAKPDADTLDEGNQTVD